MALPWLGILDTAIDMATMALARRARKRADSEDQRQLVAGGANPGVPPTLETHLAGVVVAALKEVFERDTRRLDLEREQAGAERERAERALRLELLRQAADREIGGAASDGGSRAGELARHDGVGVAPRRRQRCRARRSRVGLGLPAGGARVRVRRSVARRPRARGRRFGRDTTLRVGPAGDAGGAISSSPASACSARRSSRNPVMRLYVRVLVLEAAILVGLWLFGRAFS